MNEIINLFYSVTDKLVHKNKIFIEISNEYSSEFDLLIEHNNKS